MRGGAIQRAVFCASPEVSLSARQCASEGLVRRRVQHPNTISGHILNLGENGNFLEFDLRILTFRMVGGRMGGFWTSFALLAVASGGPLHRYPRESEDYQNDLSMYANYTANEVCFSEGEVFQKGDMMPNPGPCEECRCEPPSIVCNMIKCPTNNNGCRTIQRANHCCPDYNCECDYNGQLYNDGERLELPEEPCQVCYCKGGEVMCNSITCYHRDDCDPIQVPGQCCPKYENCPVRDMGISSSDDKNILVRSTNKTNHISPKREMNPWLLTKLPATSSSSPPKSPQDPTTEGGNIIIVSDWLTERRTTTEDASQDDEGRRDYYNFDSTDEPELLTNSDQPTTILKQEISSDGAVVVKNSDTITPIDEVIFTRIDAAKPNQEVNLEQPTSISSKDIIDKLTTGISVSEINTQSTENAAGMNITEAPFYTTQVNEDSRELNSTINKDKQTTAVHLVVMTDDSENSSEIPVKIKELSSNDQSAVSTDTSTIPSVLITLSKVNSTDSDSATTLPNKDSSTKAKEDLKGVVLENVFGVGGLSIGKLEQETTIRDLLGSYPTEEQTAATNAKGFTDDTVEGQTKEGYKLGNLKIDVNEVKPASVSLSETTTNNLIDSVVTTPFFVEINLKNKNINKNDTTSMEMLEDHETGLTKIKNETIPDLNKNEMAISQTVDQNEGYTEMNILIPDSETMEETNQPHSQSEVKPKRENSNSSIDQVNLSHNKDDLILSNNNDSVLPDTIPQQMLIPGGITEAQDEILNDTTIMKMLINSSVSTVRDDIIPTLIYLGDESDENKEFISDAPPVLELNSHVPFLQLGGHENIDSAITALGINHQTTLNADQKEKLLLKELNSTESIISPEITTDSKIKHSNIIEIKKDFGENYQDGTETTTDPVFTTSHITLTPGDLKALAEFLINDTIKTVQVRNASDYVPNQWLKGNLTSEENMSSILSAANISIAIMNQTEDKLKNLFAETTTRVGEAIRLDKFEKDKLNSVNSALNNVKIDNKTGIIQGKSDEYLDFSKINSVPETTLNDEAKEAMITVKTNTEPQSNIKKSLFQNATIISSENSPEKYQINNNKSLDEYHAQPESSTSRVINIFNGSQHVSGKNLQLDKTSATDKIETYQKSKKNQFRNDKITDVSVPSFTPALSVTTNDPQKQPTPYTL